MKTTHFFTALIIFCLIGFQAGAQKYAIGEKVTLNSSVLDETRSILVYTPETYDLGAQHYPVMYLLDGTAHFHHVSGIVRFLAGNGLMPEIIVVAIENVDRTRDFSPTHVDKYPTTGGAKQFMAFLTDELIPMVETNYRTEPYRMLVGHSFGGEFATYALLDYPEVFKGIIAISPYMQYDDGYIVKHARTALRPEYDNVRFYMTVGNEPDYFETLDEFENLLESKTPKGLDFAFVKMLDENHGSIPHLSVYFGLEAIFNGWGVSNTTFNLGLAAIDFHYQDLSAKYGYTIKTPEYTINLLGYNYLNKEDFDEAIRVFKENVKRYPSSANVYDSLGEAFEKSGKNAQAEKNYAKAVELAEKVNHPNLAIYKKNLERMQKENTAKK